MQVFMDVHLYQFYNLKMTRNIQSVATGCTTEVSFPAGTMIFPFPPRPNIHLVSKLRMLGAVVLLSILLHGLIFSSLDSSVSAVQ